MDTLSRIDTQQKNLKYMNAIYVYREQLFNTEGGGGGWGITCQKLINNTKCV